MMPSLLAVFMAIVGGIIFGIMAKFSLGRYLLEKYPTLFSFGLASKDGPSKEMAENTNFHMTLVGLGWKTEVSDPKANHQEDPNRKVKA
jgi:hypothetical protein